MADRLAREDWAPHTKGMFLGQTRRIKHVCGPGQVLMISLGHSGYRAWCFRCVAGDSMPRPDESLADKLARVRAGQAADEQLTDDLPEPRVGPDSMQEWPMAARLWLYRAGIGASETRLLGAYYHPPTNRVVLPVHGNGGVVYYQARSIDGRNPKYLGPATGKARALPRWGDSPLILVTEDILSAFKIGLAGGEGWCALGVRLSAHFLSNLLRSGKPVGVWLDPDPAGQAGAGRILKQLLAYGINAANVVSEKDPKLHTKEYIRGRIQDQLAAG